LPVRTERAAHVGALVPAQAQPVEPVVDRLLVGRLVAVQVGVVHAQHEAPAPRAGEKKIEEGGAGGPQVHVTGWAWGHAHPDRAVWHPQIVGATLASPSAGRTLPARQRPYD